MIPGLAVLPYLQNIYGQPIWDDKFLVGSQSEHNTIAQCFIVPFLERYFRPMVLITFLIERHLWGSNFIGFHLSNVLLHALTTGAVIGLVRAAFNSRPLAALCGLFFAVQPAQVSAVAWVGGRTDSLTAFFLSVFAWSLIAAVRSEGRNRALLLAASTSAFVLAVLTKEQALAALPLAPLSVRCFAGEAERKALYRQFTWPFVVASAAFVVMWFVLVPPPASHLAHGMLDQLVLIGRSITYFTLLLIAPTPQWMHTLTGMGLENSGWWNVPVGYAIFLGACVFFARWMKRAPGAAWFLAFVVLMLLPVANLVPVPTREVAPYKAAIAGLGMAGLLGLGLHTLLLKLASSRRSILKTYTLFAVAAYIIVSAGLTTWGAGRWQSESKVDATFIRYDPENLFARWNMSVDLVNRHEPAKAIRGLEDLLAVTFGSNNWENTETALRAFQVDSRIKRRVEANQGFGFTPGKWISRAYLTLALAKQDVGDRAGALAALKTGLAFDRSYQVRMAGPVT